MTSYIDEFEAFVKDWMERIAPKYHYIEFYTGPRQLQAKRVVLNQLAPEGHTFFVRRVGGPVVPPFFDEDIEHPFS